VRRLALTLAFGVAACTGTIDDGAGSGTGPRSGGNVTPGGKDPVKNPPGGTGGTGGSMTMMPPDTMNPPSAQVTCPGNMPGKDIVGRRALRRLTIPEFEATIRGAFGLDSKQWVGLNVPPDAGSDDGFTNNVDRLTVSPEYARGAAESSRAVAGVVSGELLPTLLPCAATGGASCADNFVTTFGTKLYRRPLTPVEKGRYMALFSKTSQGGDFKTFVYWATSAMLQSPNVIYRSELGEPDGGRFKLTPYEVASELSYTFTGGPPTPELMQLAAANKLSTGAEVEAAARALVFDGQNVKPAFREVIQRFADQWLGLSKLSNLKKDTMLYPGFNTQIQDSLAEETRRFISSVILEDKGKVADLLTANYTFVDSRLAKYYGFGAATGTDFVRVNRPAEWGIGLLAQGSMLSVAANSLATSPTRRGHMVRSNLMCVPVPPPPPTVDPVQEPSEFTTTRERYEKLHSDSPACRDCHLMMDPIGFAFEHLDAAGRYRSKEGKFDIDDTGLVSNSSKGDLPVKGATELAQAISTLPEVTDCMASYVAAYALGVSHDSAACLINTATAELRNGMSLVDFYVRMARSDHFRFRQ
jgi:hypothetical protein